MSKSVSYCILVVFAGVVIVLSCASPSVLSDTNKFLSDFVSTNLLNVLGVILAITLASAATLHIELNHLEEQYGQRGAFGGTRAGVHSAAYWLIGLFLMAVVVVVVKPLVANAAWTQSIFNGSALLIVLWNVLILLSLTQTTFRIKPKIEDD